ncbi:MAG: hypothetical protein LQ340_003340 [Diploschistes diacapsis]|nr:MAG: hypothetical protein LQ340_003340 [Diploschistes diacapsis]
MHIYHTNPSYDPIFPAHEAKFFPNDNEPLYYNSDPRARVFACVDATTLASPSGDESWPLTAPAPASVHVGPAYWLTKWSLESSTVYDALAWRLGRALLAQESIGQSVASGQLHASRQWEDEAEHLFATSLARIQFDAMAIATGAGRERPGYRDMTPDEGRGKLCGLWKFKTVGYTNVNVVTLAGLAAVLPVAAVLSSEWGSVTWVCGGRCGGKKGGWERQLVIFVLFQEGCRVLATGGKWVARPVLWLFRRLWGLCAGSMGRWRCRDGESEDHEA